MFQATWYELPALDRIHFLEEELVTDIRDDEIFQELMIRGKRFVPVRDGAEEGDFVLYQKRIGAEEALERQVVLGKGYDPEAERLLVKSCPGDVFAIPQGELTVVSVKRRKEMELTDEAIRQMRIPQVDSLEDYRINYLKQHENRLKSRAVSRNMGKYLEQYVSLARMELDKAELAMYCEQEKEALLRQLGGSVPKYVAMLHQSFDQDGNTPTEICEQKMEESYKESYVQIVIGKELARRDGCELNADSYRNFVESVAAVTGRDVDTIKRNNPEERYPAEYYKQYLTSKLASYLRPYASITVNGRPFTEKIEKDQEEQNG